jgi:hypothetical protein
VDNVQKVVTDQLRALPHEDFQHCYREWERLRRCVASQRKFRNFSQYNITVWFSKKKVTEQIMCSVFLYNFLSSISHFK